MSEPKLISPMLDNFVMGDPISDHNGVRCCPAMEKDTEEKYIVKIISNPASQVQLDALLLTGAYKDKEEACAYFKELSDGVVKEAETLQRLSALEGFVSMDSWQVVPMEDETGYDVYLLTRFQQTLERYMRSNTMTHLGALNLGLDLCAALSVCRRAGYLYADLKPSNVFMTDSQEYKIGDLGFLSLSSLKYASLPEKYRSAYTAPEVADAFSALNATMDVYAAGLILYQAFNGGELPFTGDTAPEESFPAPLYADYEMAEIILKACSPFPEERWQDPMAMGQALVSYMQRNGANDTPIVPPPVPVTEELPEEAELSPEDEEGNASTDTIDAVATEETAEDVTEPEAEIIEENSTESQESPAEDEEEKPLYNEDDFGNLSFLDYVTAYDGLDDPEAIAYSEVSQEVTSMLEQADELIAHPTPEPVVAPEKIDVPIPEPIQPEPEQAEEEAEEADEAQTAEGEETAEESTPDQEEADIPAEEEYEEAPRKKKSSGVWFRVTLISLIVLILLASAACGIYYYQNYYLQNVQSIMLDGNETSLTVSVNSNAVEDLLTVICSDSYGNQLEAPVIDGKATFTNLVPDTAYTIRVSIKGFHRLTGDTSTAYSTPDETEIVQFSGVTGAENGSMILGFTIDGPDSDQWTVFYSAQGEEEKSTTFAGHMVTLTGLVVGKEYTLRLEPEDDLFVSGTQEIKLTASNLIYAENLAITACEGNKLTAAWNGPDAISVQNWTVRCFNDSGYDQTVVIEDTAVTFEAIDPTKAYTVEVTAAGMSVNERAFVTANPLTVKNFQASTETEGHLYLTWECDTIPQSGWLLTYTVDNAPQESIACAVNSAILSSVAPGATYTFTLQDAGGATVFGGTLTCTAPTE